MNTSKTSKRLNITLNPDTWDRFKIAVPRMERSKFIDYALRVYLTHLKKENLRKKLKEEALSNASEDLKITNEWFHLDKDVWDKI